MEVMPPPRLDSGLHERFAKVKHTPKEARRGRTSPRQSNSPPDPPLDPPRECRHAPPPSSFAELPHLTQMQRHTGDRCRQNQRRLHAAHITAARTTRLALAAPSVRRILADSIKFEDKPSFANLFNAFHDSLSDSSSGLEENDSHGESSGYPQTCLDQLGPDSRKLILDLLSKLRADPTFLAARLASLTQQQLIALLQEKGVPRSENSVFGSAQRSGPRASKHLGYVVDGQMELLSSHDLISPLEILIHSTRRWPTINLQADKTATDIWASACTRLIIEQRSGSERLVPAVIESWATSSPSPGRERLEVWLLDTLQQGSFLLEKSRQLPFNQRLEGRPVPDEDIKRDEFYVEAANALLRLLAAPEGASIIPPGALELCRAIHIKLASSPGHQRAFPHFAITRWLFPLFLSDAIVSPEALGLLTDYFVSEPARQRILREVARRCSKIVFDVVYSWKVGIVPSEHDLRLVRNLSKIFQGPEKQTQDSDREDPLLSNEHAIIAMTATDISAVVKALYPLSPKASSLDGRESTYSGLRSSASSISGFSLFPAPGHLDRPFGDLSGSVPLWEKWPFGHPDSLPEISSLYMTTDVSDSTDIGRLHEIRRSIEDSCPRRRPGAVDHWCILVDDGKGGGLRTVRDKIITLSLPPAAESGTIRLSRFQRDCRRMIGDLLDQGDLSFEAYSSSGKPLEQTAVINDAIVEALLRRRRRYEDNMDLVQAHECLFKLSQLDDLTSNGKNPANLNPILEVLRTDRQQAINSALETSKFCDKLLRCTNPCLDRQSKTLSANMSTMRRMRDKMWYIADVRTSGIYEDVRAIVSALKVMAQPQVPARTRLATSSRTTSSKGSILNFHSKSESQILDILTASASHGGRNKFNDDQSRALLVWIESRGIENLCRGEERIHKLCREIQKVIEQVTSETSTLLASDLLSRDRPGPPPMERPAQTMPSPVVKGSRFDILSLRTDVPPNVDVISNSSSYAPSARSLQDQLDSWSPSATNRSSASVWSPTVTEARSPSSVTSVGTSQTRAAGMSPAKSRPGASTATDALSSIDTLRQHTTSLLISDLAHPIFGDGSETDVAFWTGFGGELSERYLRTLLANSPGGEQGVPSARRESFDFEDAFERLISHFSASSNPYSKLKVLREIDGLFKHCKNPLKSDRARPVDESAVEAASPAPVDGKVEEHVGMDADAEGEADVEVDADVKMDCFRRLFCTKATRPDAIFRDLQYIAALVPSRTLETTDEGKAFCNAAVAICNLRQHLITAMVETADSIIAHHSNKRGHGRSSSIAQQQRDSAAFTVPNRSPSPEDVSNRSMADAALLLQITAKEGNAVAQRELATLYLTHPELMDHIIAPLSRPRDVFKEELESKWRKNQDPARCDPTTMCVAHHWMSLSSKGGDALAREFLRQREEMERLP